MIGRRWFALTALAVGAASLGMIAVRGGSSSTSVSSGSGNSSEPSAQPVADLFVVRDDLVMPLNTHAFGGSSPQRWLEEQQHEFAKCMRAQGFDVRDVPFQPDETAATVAELAEYRRAHGYGIADREQPVDNTPAEATHNNGYRATLHAETLRRYVAIAGAESENSGGPFSEGGDGCLGESRSTVAQRHPRFPAANMAAKSVYDREARTGGRLTKAKALWGQCLADNGITVDPGNIGAVQALLAAEVGPPLPGNSETHGTVDWTKFRERELQMAAIDFECWKTYFHPVSIDVQRAAFAEAGVHADGSSDVDRERAARKAAEASKAGDSTQD